MKIIAFLLTFTTVFSAPIQKENQDFYKSVFPNAVEQESLKIPDPISDKPINTTILRIKNLSKKTIGYIREIKTTTGCDSACLPVVFTLFYNSDKELVKLKSRPGLTKKFHAPFTVKDYEKLDLVLLINPTIFKKVKHPTEMVDALSGETKKEFRAHVVKEAAYSTLRVNLYNQQTRNFLKTLP